MSTIRVSDKESIDEAIKRWKRRCQKDNIMGDLRKKECYEKPSIRKKKKAEAARKKSMSRS